MLSVVELVDDTVVAEMEVGELAVGVDEIREVHRAARPCRRAADLGDMEFEAVRQIDADTVFGAGHRVPDLLANRLDDARHCEAAAPRLDIDSKPFVGNALN